MKSKPKKAMKILARIVIVACLFAIIGFGIKTRPPILNNKGDDHLEISKNTIVEIKA